MAYFELSVGCLSCMKGWVMNKYSLKELKMSVRTFSKGEQNIYCGLILFIHGFNTPLLVVI